MKREISEAIKEAGFSRQEISEIQILVWEENHVLMKEMLRRKRKDLLADIYQKDEQIRHIDWIIYSLETGK